VEVTLDGYETAQEDVTVTSGEHREITIDLVPAAVATPPETGAGQAAQGEPDGAAGLDPAWFWATASAAAAIGVAAAVTGGLTYTTFADFDAGGRHDQGLSDKGDALQVTTNVLAGVAGAAALAAVVLVFFTDFSEEQATAPEAGPAVAWWPGGIAVSW
jgi:hypothetical protein